MSPNLPIRDQDVLLVVDIQNDFCPGGGLAVQARGADARLASTGPSVICLRASGPKAVRHHRSVLWSANPLAGSLRAGDTGSRVAQGPGDCARRVGLAQGLSSRHRLLLGILRE